MSESERKRRLDYQKQRSRNMWVQGVIIILVALILLASFITYRKLDQAYYIEYTEDAKVDYKVSLKENEFYEKGWQNAGQAYVSTLIDKVLADFDYTLQMNADNVVYAYSYTVDAQLKIMDNNTNVPIFQPTFPIKSVPRTEVKNKPSLTLREQVMIDYTKYNELANNFLNTYLLTGTSSSLIVTMHINVISACEQFTGDNANTYTVSLNIPLTKQTSNITMTSSVPTSETKVVACSSALDPNIFLVASLASLFVELVLIAILIAYAYLTRNHDVNYTIRVKKLLNSYKSYIQRLENPFDTKGYQLLYVSTFEEMLGIRDTIQSPVLMYENIDRTRAQFLIPTATKILYVFEVKIDNYDEIYKDFEETPAPAPVKEPLRVVVPAPIKVITNEKPAPAPAPEPAPAAPVAAPAPANEPLVVKVTTKKRRSPWMFLLGAAMTLGAAILAVFAIGRSKKD